MHLPLSPNTDLLAEIARLRAHTATLDAALAIQMQHATQLERLLAHAPIGLALLDSELRFLHINAHLAAINGLPPEAHLGHRLSEVLPRMAPLFAPILTEVLTTGELRLNNEAEGSAADAPSETHVWQIHCFPVRTADGARIGVGVMLLDITARRQAEQALQAERQQLDTIVHTLHEGLIAFRPDGSVTRINAAGRQLAGSTPGDTLSTLDAVGQELIPLDASGQPLPPAAYPFARILRGERFVELEVCMRAPHQKAERWLVFNGSPVYDDQGALTLGVVTSQDITQRKQAELALQARSAALSQANIALANALRLKDAFLAMMSHELRTPLTAILGFAETLAAGHYGDLSEPQRGALAIIAARGQQLHTILAGMLDLAQLEAGQAALDCRPIDVHALCHTALESARGAAQQKDIHLRHRLAAGVTRLHADERRMTQILDSLLDNAIKFTPAGGSVGLEVRDDAAQGQIQFIVWDTGIGIAEADAARIFQPFTQGDGRPTRAYDGIGLGLSLAYRLAVLHGGAISLESTLGEGSRFTVSLPCAAAASSFLVS